MQMLDPTQHGFFHITTKLFQTFTKNLLIVEVSTSFSTRSIFFLRKYVRKIINLPNWQPFWVEASFERRKTIILFIQSEVEEREKKLDPNPNPRQSMQTNYRIQGKGNCFFLPKKIHLYVDLTLSYLSTSHSLFFSLHFSLSLSLYIYIYFSLSRLNLSFFLFLSPSPSTFSPFLSLSLSPSC